MKNKILITGFGLLALALLSFSSAYAHGEGYSGHGGYGWRKCSGLEKMFFMKTHFISKKSHELGLSQE